jgi:hypothetical protein
VYLKGALGEPDFQPLVAFPDLYRRYESEELFPFFANRVLSQDRPDWPTLARALDLPDDTDPVFVLAETGGRRATDTFEVFCPPRRDEATGRCKLRFLARGIRHLPGAEDRIERLSAGDRLEVVRDVMNEETSRARLLVRDAIGEVGWIPDLLLDTFDSLDTACGDDIVVRVVKVNGREVPARARLLCDLDACSPGGSELPAGPAFQPVI